MTESERRDRIVAAALEWHRTYSDGSAGETIAFIQAEAALCEACQPITPPYKPLLSDEELARHIAPYAGGEGNLEPTVRLASAATLEAVVKVLADEDAPEPVICRIEYIARQEREYARGE